MADSTKMETTENLSGDALAFLEKLAAQLEYSETIDTLHSSIKAALKGYSLQSPIIPAKYVFCRARVLDTPILPHELSTLWFPPAERVAADHRAGRAGTSLFYCANNNMTALRESPVTSGQFAALSFWRSRNPLVVGAVGYSQESLRQLGSRRNFYGWGKPEARRDYADSAHGRVTALLASCFTKPAIGNSPSAYRASIAIAEMFLRQQVKLAAPIGDRFPKTFDAVMYPSIDGNGDGDNFAIQPATVVDELEPLRVEVWHIHERASSWTMQLVNTAMSFAEGGRIVWNAAPVKTWEADTVGGRLRFAFTDHGFATTDAAGNVIQSPTEI